MANEILLPKFESKIEFIPEDVQQKMKQFTWQTNCPVHLDDLRYVELNYFGFDNKTHVGHLIVNKELADEVVIIFEKLYNEKFPIESMKPLYQFKGDDEASMLVNNTSAFNCRRVTSRPNEFSQHSYGRAIDINPKINPYVHGKTILPTNAHTDLACDMPGRISKSSLIYEVFTQHGWDWGGGWYDLQDYQHFEKRANGEKRNPYGYDVGR